MEVDKMSDFSPDMEKNNSSKLNTESADTGVKKPGLRKDKPNPAGPAEKPTGDTMPYRIPGVDSTDSTDPKEPTEKVKKAGKAEKAEKTQKAEKAEKTQKAEKAEKMDAAGDSGTASGQEENSADDPVSAQEEASADNSASGQGETSGDDSASAQKENSADGSASAQEGTSADGSATGQEKDEKADSAASADKKKAAKSKTASYKDKILRHKRRRYRRTIIVVVLAMIILVSAVILWMRRGYTRAELIRISALSSDDTASYENLGGNVVQYGNNGAVCVDQRGNTLWNVTYEMQQPITSVSGNVIAIASRGGYYIYVMDTRGLMGTIQTTLPIHSIAAAENGEVAVIMNDTRATWIRLYTAEGREIAYLVRTMAENGYPIAAAVSPDGETLCLSSVSLSNAAVKTDISFYNFGSSGQKRRDYRVQHSESIDEVFPYLHYMDNTTCLCVSDRRLLCFWSTFIRRSGSSYAEFSDNILGVFGGDSFIGVLSTNTKGDSHYTLSLYNKRGKKAGSVNFTMQYTDIDLAGDKVYIHNEQECQIFTISGRCLFDGKFDKSIRAMIPGAGLSDLLVVTDGEVDSVRLH